eukprot:4902719-Pleurochrysis_carterae.AAC.2
MGEAAAQPAFPALRGLLLLTALTRAVAVATSTQASLVSRATWRPSVLAVSPHEAATLLGGAGRARAIWEQLRQGIDPFDEDALPKTVRAHLQSHSQ